MSGFFRVYLKRKLEYLDHILNAFRKIFLQLFAELYSTCIQSYILQISEFFSQTVGGKIDNE